MSRGDRKAYSADASSDYSSSSSKNESDENDDGINVYHMRIVRNRWYGHPTVGSNSDSVIRDPCIM